MSGIRIAAVHAEQSSEFVWRNPANDKDETHVGGEARGLDHQAGEWIRIYFAGDTALLGDMRLIGARYRPDLALVPIGGNFAMDPKDAAWSVTEMIKPRAVIPTHEAMGDSAIRTVVAVPGTALEF